MWLGVEEYYLSTLLAGVAVLTTLRLFPKAAGRQASTALSLAFMGALLFFSCKASGLPGLVGIVAFPVGAAAVLSAHELLHEDKPLHDALTLALAGSLPLLAGSTDLIRIFVAWELMSICVLLLVGLHRERESAEAVLKYLMLCGVGTAVALTGIALAVFETGSVGIESIAKASILSKALMLVGFSTEAAVFPLHFWLPDAHMVAPSTASAMLSGIVIESAAVLVYRLAGSDPVLSQLLLYLSIAGAFIGNLSALAQDDIKRMLAYSSIANVSYIIMGLFSGDATAKAYALLHIAAHGYLKAALFILSGVLLANYGTRKLSQLTGSLSSDNILKFILVGCSIGLMGAPPLLPFWTELYIAVGLFNVNILLPLFFAICVILSFGYYFRLFYSLSQGAPKLSTQAHGGYLLTKISVVLLLLQNFLLFLFPSLLIGWLT
ncbi:MAG: proton-conducting transporter membrane subunit [Infirmifilum sp.]